MSGLIAYPLGGAGTILTYGLGPSSGIVVDFRQALVARLATSTNLVAIVDSRIYPEHLPESSALPALVYSVVSATRVYSLQGASGVVTYRVQLSAFARTLSECAVIVEAIRQNLDGLLGVTLSGTVRVLWANADGPEVDTYDQPDDSSDVGTHMVAIDYLFKVRESRPSLT